MFVLGARRLLRAVVFLVVLLDIVRPEILTPPYFNLAEGRKVYASATCGEDTEGPELYCKLVGQTNAENDVNINVIKGQHCDVCDPNKPDKRHPPEFAVDGMETWWQSPPLSRGMKYNEVNFTIDLGQEFHVAYVYVRMGNSPRPGLWILEKSVDYGKTYSPWQYFSDSISDCITFFGEESVQPISRDDSVICSTDHSKIVPLEGGEIPISLLNHRPSANHYFNSSVLQEWTRATNVRLRLLRTKNLYGHLMSMARLDPTVTRRYFYSIKDISIGGRCMCNGHADTCDNRDPADPAILVCLCRHNTCGSKCDSCCPGFEQKAWRQSKSSAPFRCEPCNCFNHTNECIYDPEIDAKGLSLDIHGKYEGGGVCQNCQHNTEGINCNKCKEKFYRPYSKSWNETDVCQPCNCDTFYSTGNCSEGSGRCECRKEYSPPNCDSCSFGYYGYPSCKACECYLNGTLDLQCVGVEGKCPCKKNFGGDDCKTCAEEYYNFPTCEPCECNPLGSLSSACETVSGNCTCKNNYGGKQCEQCHDGYYGYPSCLYCNCDARGTESEICDKESGKCICKEGYGGERCDQCIPGYYGYPDCKPCYCSNVGSRSTTCDAGGKCSCLSNFAGRNCTQCSPGHYSYPDCLPCECDLHGTIGITCDDAGVCQCRNNFDGEKCDGCKDGFYNFPACEECNCNPAGVTAEFAGCGSVPKGELCECKDRVEGRICDKCKPLYWNLNAQNADGCEDCDCHAPGVLGGIRVCDNEGGQCACKPSVVARACSECQDGSFDLSESNLFGCTDCDCDVGGSVDGNCDKLSGQCTCQPRVTGRNCKEPLQIHYFPTLYHYQYEVEDGRVADGVIRYHYNETVFPNFSWKGYAVFTKLQREIMKDIYINKPSIYQMVFRYVNNNPDTVTSTIKIVPESASDVEQKHQVQFKHTSEPAFVTISSGNVPIALVMNPGKWTVHILSESNLLLDYFVLLPEEFYMPTILNQKVEAPCMMNSKGLCREFGYPKVFGYDASLGGGGYVDLGSGDIATMTEYYEDEEHLKKLKVRSKVPLINNSQKEIDYNVTLSKPGRYVLLINYVTPLNSKKTHIVDVGVITNNDIDYRFDRIEMYDCPYTTMCRQVVTKQDGIVAVYSADENTIHVKLRGNDTNVGIQSIVAVPYGEWSLDFIQPRPICIRKDDECIESTFLIPPESKKIQFEKEAIINDEQSKEIIKISNSTTYIYLGPTDSMVDVRSKVNSPGLYTFILHFYQPDFPEYDINVLIQNGMFYEAKLPVRHCPSKSGCRAVITQKDGTNKFPLTENFMITFEIPKTKNVFLDYLLVVPHDLYDFRILEEEGLDRTGDFIKNCGNDHFYIDTKTEGFCRESVFSITTGYNNGALSCQCDFDGSLSFICEQFGGQCQCKENVVGRQCSICKTGYYGFPDCKKCNCPATSNCEESTGQCICPMNVVGEQCDQCAPYTFGYDSFTGCLDCRCEPLGVESTMQCNVENGTCGCKPNVVGRKCDACRPGHFAFPYCEQCECDPLGTTSEICHQDTAECFCKKFVTGPACDICMDGTYNLQEYNEVGCTECFCFGKTSRCYSSTLFRTFVLDMRDWKVAALNDSETFNMTEVEATLHKVEDNAIGLKLDDAALVNRTVYFSAPKSYLGKQLTSYGGYLNFTLFCTLGGSGKASMKPDVIIVGPTTHLIFNNPEQPAAAQDFITYLEMVESNFVLPNGVPARREHLMTVLKDVQAIYIRATYWNPMATSRLTNVVLDNAVRSLNGTKYYDLASTVEQCDCPPNYMGLSCEECAPGYYRTSGPHGGYCVPCQCNRHAEECDVNTGVCIDCQHNTIGDHCEMCEVGYHGNALQGTPMDCLICACPLPVTSNNFATGCEVSSDGERISCDCNDGYTGGRCQSCADGFYGRPEILGDYCKPCECSGNIDPTMPGSCETTTGECLKCLNNTYGTACALCKPGYYGDAIVLKDCQACICDDLGTEKCNSTTGLCVCRKNVVGDKCDRCEVDHYGFNSGDGCDPCDCADASSSLQCDDQTGQCMCKPGVTGRTCDRCTPGYWNYTSEGCTSCGCKSEYSLGFGCNAQTGQCECLPGVTGDKCDRCPYRWSFVEEHGCFACDSCTHDLLDFTDELSALIDPVQIDFDAVDSGYFTTRRLSHINDTIKQLKPKVKLLSKDKINLTPIMQELDAMEQESNNMNRKANYSLDNSRALVKDANDLRTKSDDAIEAARDAADEAGSAIDDIEQLAENLVDGQGPVIDTALGEAEGLLENIKAHDLSERRKAATDKKDEVVGLLEELKTFKKPFDSVNNNVKELKAELADFNEKLDDLSNQTQYSLAKSAEAKELYDRNGKDRLEKKLNSINTQSDEIGNNLKQSDVLLKNASDSLNKTRELFNYLRDYTLFLSDDNDNFNATLEKNFEKLREIDKIIPKVQSHADEQTKRAQELDNLLTETRNTSENAVRAATAYNDIINAINDAEAAAEMSKEDASDTLLHLHAIENDTLDSDLKSSELLEDAHAAAGNVKELLPELEHVRRGVRSLQNTNEEQLKNIRKILDNFQSAPLDKALMSAKDNADEAQVFTRKTEKDLDSGFNEIANRTESAKKLPKQLYDASSDIVQVRNQLKTVNETLPKLLEAIKNLPDRQSQDREISDDLQSKIKKLRQQIALARDLANRIDVGVKFNPKTMLELKNPDNLADLSTSSQISGYFRTDKPNGLLLYLGNENGTNLPRTKTDDYMALEIQNGYPVMTLDIGNGPERIVNNKYVSDNNWYQFIIDRTGLNAKLTIKEQLPDGTEKETTAEQQLEGPYSIFNLDKNQSKLFVGSYRLDFKMQDNIEQNMFDGEIEGLVVGETPVSLWNFNQGYENNEGAKHRDKLIHTQSTGYRFNGNGYAILNSRSYAFRSRSGIQLSFKTFAMEGLLFLYGKNKTFIALELRNGKVFYKYNLGSGTKIWHTTKTYNDGIWHTVEASRDQANGLFVVDGVEVPDSTKQITGSFVEQDDTVFFGGYPQMHGFKDVTNIDFDGCIDNVMFLGSPVDLSSNIKAYGVIPGCPVKFSRLVSFYPNRPGYIKKDNVSASNDFRVNLKFKTKEKDGLIFYATDMNQESGVSLSLHDGYLKLISQKIVLTTKSHTFNDNEWHVVSVRHNDDSLRLDFDDYGYSLTDAAPPKLYLLYGNIYIGGLPKNFVAKKGMIENYAPFAGCIGDATINGNIINFANSTDKHFELVGKCILEKEIGSDSDIHTVPVLPPVKELGQEITDTDDLEKENVSGGDLPSRGDGGRDTGGGGIPDEEESTEEPDGEGETEFEMPETTTVPAILLQPKSTPPPSVCALPSKPDVDLTVLQTGSYRYGTTKESRLEFQLARGKYRKQYDFQLEFRTLNKNGIIFYMSNVTQYVALFMRNGYLHYSFNGGLGTTTLSTKLRCDDNVWHEVSLSRDGTIAKLVVDGTTIDGKAPDGTVRIEIPPPFYLGGVQPSMYNQVLANLNMTENFNGCVRSFYMNSKPMVKPTVYGVIPCSEHVEEGVFFGHEGGYVRLKERFKVGVELDVKMDIKPRNLSGVVMAVHGRRDYFVIELDNGALKLTVDNGKGAVTTRYQPSAPYLFCDGEWHSIQAVKSKSVVTLAVNGVYSEPGVGDYRATHTNTGGSLFLGGHKYIARAKGLTVRSPYRGCIKNVQLNNVPIKISPSMAEGDITTGSCPTN